MAPPTSSSDRTQLPDWLAEAVDVLSARRRLAIAVAVGIVLVGAMVALAAPSILPPRPLVGTAVGIAGALLAVAAALALDASDLVVRGGRHVTAAGGKVDVRVGRIPDDVGPLLAAVARHASSDQPVRIALTPASRSAAVPGPRAAALAEALARTGRRVLLTDLSRGSTPAGGLSDVVAGRRQLSEVVRFEQELYLARLAVGSDPATAIRDLPRFVESMPSDLEVLVAAMPPLAEPGVLKAVEAFDVTFVMVEVDRTERVDLIASLDAMDAAPVTSELVLIDPAAVEAREEEGAPAAEEPEAATADEPVAAAIDAEWSYDEGGSGDVVVVPRSTPSPGPASDVEAGDDVLLEGEVVRGGPVGPEALVGEPDDEDQPAAAAYSFDGDAEEGAGDEEDDGSLVVPDVPSEAVAAAHAGAEPVVFDDLDGDDDEDVGEPVWETAQVEDEEQPPAAALSGELDSDERDPLETTEIVLPAMPTGGAEPTSGPASPHHYPEEPAPEVEPEPEPVESWEPEPEPVAEPEPAPGPGPAPVTSFPEPEPAQPAADLPAPDWDEAAVEVARTSAALQQLAQQVWDREGQ